MALPEGSALCLPHPSPTPFSIVQPAVPLSPRHPFPVLETLTSTVLRSDANDRMSSHLTGRLDATDKFERSSCFGSAAAERAYGRVK